MRSDTASLTIRFSFIRKSEHKQDAITGVYPSVIADKTLAHD